MILNNIAFHSIPLCTSSPHSQSHERSRTRPYIVDRKGKKLDEALIRGGWEGWWQLVATGATNGD